MKLFAFFCLAYLMTGCGFSGKSAPLAEVAEEMLEDIARKEESLFFKPIEVEDEKPIPDPTPSPDSSNIAVSQSS